MSRAVDKPTIEFKGYVRPGGQFGCHNLGRIAGRYRWIDENQVNARVDGYFVCRRSDDRTMFNPFKVYQVQELRGRSIALAIRGVGLFPARIYTAPAWDAERLSLWALNDECRVAFHSIGPPIPIIKPAELGEMLRVAIRDALHEAGRPDFADASRAAAVALFGFPREEEWPDDVDPPVEQQGVLMFEIGGPE